MSVDLERQLAAYGEHLEALAEEAAPNVEASTQANERSTYWRGLSVAVAAATAILLVIGSIALLAPFAGEPDEPVADPTTPPRVVATTIPITPLPSWPHQTTEAPVRSFSLEPAGPGGPPFDAGSFGEVVWQRFDVPAGRSFSRGIDTAYGFAAIGDEASIRTSVDGSNWVHGELPFSALHLVASGEDLYALGSGAVRLTWTGANWETADVLSIPDPSPEILAEGGYLDFAEQIAIGDGVAVITARSRVFYSTDESTFVPAVQGPDPALLERDSAGTYRFAGGCDPHGGGGGWDEGRIGPVFWIESGFLAYTSGHPRDWTEIGFCRPVIWRSNDGSTWELVSTASPFGPDGFVEAIAEHDGRFVAVGGHGDSQAAMWVSDDGLNWDRIHPRQIRGSLTNVPWAIAGGDAGWVALFGEAGTDNEVRAMYSVDGREWVVDAGPLPGAWWAWAPPDIAVGTDSILVTSYTDVAFIGKINR